MNELMTKATLAREAAPLIASCSAEAKNDALMRIADALIAHTDEIAEANRADVLRAREAGTSDAMIDRLTLSPERILSVAEGVRSVALLDDPVGETVEKTVRPNGMTIEKVRVPLGVIGMIYEARPNVTVDSAALALKSGNAILLRGSSSALSSNEKLVQIMRDALDMSEVPADAVQLITEGGHETVTEMMRLRGYIDVLIPRGSGRLISSVVENASVPVIETGVGNCHIFVDASADPEMAKRIVINAKTQRPAVCNAAETLIVHRNFPDFEGLCQALIDAGVTLHGTVEVCCRIPGARPASEKDFAEEYLSLDMAVILCASVGEAMEHIRRYSTGHTEVIVTEDASHAERFLAGIDSASVNWNVSIRFTDGFEFGFGAEIGISTQKLHARGPLGLRELCSYKYIVRGNGQIRG